MTEHPTVSSWLVMVAVAGAAALAIHSLVPASAQIHGKAEVIDGDTIRLAGQRIRLLGLDAPELGQPCLRASGTRFDCGAEAKLMLRELTSGHTISCAPKGKDRYDRVLATCLVKDTDLAWWMIAKGYAISAQAQYDGAEERAQSKRMGLWAGTFTDPLTHRRMRQWQ